MQGCRRLYRILCGLLLVMQLQVMAELPQLQVLVGLHKPPYIDMSTSSGYEVELLTALFARFGKRVEFTHVPNGRLLPLFAMGAFDAVTLQPADAMLPEYFYSCPYIRYQNVVATLAENKLKPMMLADLARQRVIGFQTAEQVLGEEFRWVITQMADYSETVDQRSQVDMLLRQRVDAIVLDRNILEHHLEALAAEQPIRQLTISDGLFRVAFHRAELAVQFDQAQQAFWQQAAFVQLQQRYFRQANQELSELCR